MILNVECSCGCIHRIQVDNSALCQCGATLSLRKDSAGYITPWACNASGAPRIVNVPQEWLEANPVYRPRWSDA